MQKQIVTSFMLDWIKMAREMGTLTLELLVCYFLLQGVKSLILDFSLTLEKNLGKVEKIISVCLRLLAVCCFGYAVLLLFGVVSL